MSQHTKSIMIQGTMSNAGKSILAAGLCRIFHQDGYRTAPFKSQNMALNSYITPEGLEMGRAQAVQAEAAGIVPSADMGMADMADAPVLLVGDIDRGGVFAQLYGTVALLTEEERKRIKGLIINKFRGDRSILEPGISMLEDLCGIPVVGVVPYMDVDIEDEDSLSSRLETGKGKAPAAVDLAVIRFPRISNFTDFNVFSGIPGVSLRYVTRACDLGTPDMVILPGTKNTIHDLLWMRQNGLEAAILKLADRRVPVWGICGGYQMMGEVLVDEKGVESDLPSRTSGMGLLPLKTEFEEEKIRTQVEGAFGQLDGCLGGLSGKSIEGYEIHMGRTYIDREEGAADTARIVLWRREPEICRPMDYVMETGKDRLSSRQARMDGWNRGNIYGTYVHGIFDSPGIAGAVAEALAAAKGLCLEQAADMDYRTYRQQQYDKLAEELRENLDMAAVYRIMDISQKGKMGISRKGKGEEKPDDGYTVGTGTAGRY